MKQIKCNKCGYIGNAASFPWGHDFFQSSYVAGCPKCDNRQSPGNASMRMFGGDRPFVFVNREEPVIATAVDTVLHRSDEAS